MVFYLSFLQLGLKHQPVGVGLVGVVVGTTGDVTGLVGVGVGLVGIGVGLVGVGVGLVGVGVGTAGTVMYPLSANDLIILMTSALDIGELGWKVRSGYPSIMPKFEPHWTSSVYHSPLGTSVNGIDSGAVFSKGLKNLLLLAWSSVDLVLMPFALHPANKDKESKIEVKARLNLFIIFSLLFISTYDLQEWVEKFKPDRTNVWKSRQTFQLQQFTPYHKEYFLF
jgi:hypothetical protein